MNIKSIVITTSKQFSLDWRDLAKGALFAFITPFIVAAQQIADGIINKGLTFSQITFNWQHLAMSGVAAAGIYLFHNFMQPPHTEITPAITEPDTKVVIDQNKTTITN